MLLHFGHRPFAVLVAAVVVVAVDSGRLDFQFYTFINVLRSITDELECTKALPLIQFQ